MRYGIVISVSKTKFGPIVFKEDLEVNIKKAAAIGYDGIELAIRKPEDLRVIEVKKLVRKYDLKVIAIGTGQIYGEEGLSFSDCNRAKRKEAIERVKKIIDIAGNFNSSIIIGLIRGNIEDIENYPIELLKAEERIAECLEKLLTYSEAKSTGFLLEPINRYETNIFNRIEDITSFIAKYRDTLDLERIGILADTFHMNIEEPVIEKSLKKYSGFIKHIHFADSNRWPPGYGHMDFKNIMKVLRDNNYDSFISFEMLPEPDPDTAARQSIKFIKGI